MTRRLWTYSAIVGCAALMWAPAAMGEVYAELNSAGTFVGMHTAVPRAPGQRIWEPVGAADRFSYVLNPEGDRRGDGHPDFAIDPATGLPTAVWAAKEGADFEIVVSSFDGRSWTAPIKVRTAPGIADLDPRIVFRRDGYAIVTWWQKSSSPVVRMAFMTPEGLWYDGGVVSAAGVKARKPAIRQEGMLTIVGYRTSKETGLVAFTVGMMDPSFGDGPTPFPRDTNGDPPGGGSSGSPLDVDR